MITIRPIYTRLGLVEKEILKKQIFDALENNELTIDVDGMHDIEFNYFLVDEILPELRTRKITILSHAFKRIRSLDKVLDKRGIHRKSPYREDDGSFLLEIECL